MLPFFFINNVRAQLFVIISFDHISYFCDVQNLLSLLRLIFEQGTPSDSQPVLLVAFKLPSTGSTFFAELLQVVIMDSIKIGLAHLPSPFCP